MYLKLLAKSLAVTAYKKEKNRVDVYNLL